MSECPLTSILPKHPEKNHIKRKTGNICASQIQVVCRRNSSCLWVFRRFSSEILFFLLSSTTTSLLIPTQMQNYPSRIPGLPCGQLDLPSGENRPTGLALRLPDVRLPGRPRFGRNAPASSYRGASSPSCWPINVKREPSRIPFSPCGQLDLNQHKISPTSTSS